MRVQSCLIVPTPLRPSALPGALNGLSIFVLPDALPSVVRKDVIVDRNELLALVPIGI